MNTSVLGITGVDSTDIVVIAISRSSSSAFSVSALVVTRAKLIIVTGGTIRDACTALIGVAGIICARVAVITIGAAEHRAFPIYTSVYRTRVSIGTDQVTGSENTPRFRRAGIQGAGVVVIAIGSP